MRSNHSLACPRCGAALGSDTRRCASCLATLADPWSAWESRVRYGIVALCVLGALAYAGSILVSWLHASR